MPALYIGLMSGTSMDGVDAALCEFEGTRFLRVAASHCLPYPAALRARLLRVQREEPALTLRQFCELDNAVADFFAAAVLELLRICAVSASQVTALGSHGQTVFHDPAGAGGSIQLGNPNVIAAATGITSIADFRRADIALKGQGAPLVPAFHHALFATNAEARCVVNIGGIANITALPDADSRHAMGFDTGPGNGLMDEWAELHLQRPFDDGGAWARSGIPHRALLDALLADAYFRQAPPKSTGRGYFNLAWAGQRFAALNQLAAADVQRTFCELTARTVAEAIAGHAGSSRRVLLCGGGARNEFLLERLRDLMPGMALQLSDNYGVSVNLVEAAAFAWLAMRTMHGLPGNLPAATGASRAAVLGGIYHK